MGQNVELKYSIQTSGKEGLRDLAAAQRDVRSEHERSVQPLQKTTAAAEALALAMQKLSQSEKAAAQSAYRPAPNQVPKPQTNAPQSGGVPAPGPQQRQNEEQIIQSYNRVVQAAVRAHEAELSGLRAIENQRRKMLALDGHNDELRGGINKIFDRQVNKEVGSELQRLEAQLRKIQQTDVSVTQQIENDRARTLAAFKGNTRAVAELEAQYARLRVAAQKSEANENRAKKLDEFRNSQRAVAEMVERAQQAELTGIQRIEAARKKALAEHGKTPALVNQINKVFDAQIKNEVASFGPILQDIQNALNSPFQSAEQAALSFAASLGPVGIAIGAIAVTAGAAGAAIYGLVTSEAAAAEASANMALRIGVTTETMEQLSAMARSADVDISVLERSAGILASALEDPAGAGKDVIKTIQELKLSIHQANGALKEPGPLLLEIVEALNQTESESQRLAATQKLLGRSGKELLPLIAGYKEARAEVLALGIGMDSTLNPALARVDSKVDTLTNTWGKLRKELAAQFAPVVIDYILNPVQDLLDLSKEPISNPRAAGALGIVKGRQNAEREELEKRNNELQSTLDAHAGLPKEIEKFERELQSALLAGDGRKAVEDHLRNLRSTLNARKGVTEQLESEIARNKARLDELKKTQGNAAAGPDPNTAIPQADARVNAALNAANATRAAAAKADAERNLAAFRKTKDGLQRELQDLEKAQGALLIKRLDPGVTDEAERRKNNEEFAAGERRKKQLEAALKAANEDNSEKRAAVNREIQSRENAAAEDTLSNLERIRAAHALWIGDLVREKATTEQLARARAILPKLEAQEGRKQAVELAREELQLAEALAAATAEPGQELALINDQLRIRLDLAKKLTSEDERNKAARDANLQHERALLDLYKAQLAERRKTAQEFELAAAQATSAVVTKAIETPADAARVRTAEDERATAEATFAERRRLIEEEFSINARYGKESEALKIRDLALLQARKDRVLQLADVEARAAQKLAQLRSESARIDVDRAVQLAELTGNPLDQEAAIARIHAIKIRGIEEEYARTGELFAYKRSLDEAEFDRVKRLLELRRKQLDEFREGAGRVFDALFDSEGAGAGIQKYLEGLGKSIQRTIFQNLATMAFDSLRDSLPKIGGQTRDQRDAQGNVVLGPDGKPLQEKTTLGKILAGTPFGVTTDPAAELREATGANTTATLENSTNLQNLNRAIAEHARQLAANLQLSRDPARAARDLGAEETGADARRKLAEEQAATLEAIKQTPAAQKGLVDPEALAAQAKLISSTITPAVDAADANTIATEANTAALDALMARLGTPGTLQPPGGLPGEAKADQTGTVNAVGALVDTAKSVADATKAQERTGATLSKAVGTITTVGNTLGRVAPALGVVGAIGGALGPLAGSGSSRAVLTPPTLPPDVARRAAGEFSTAPGSDEDIRREESEKSEQRPGISQRTGGSRAMASTIFDSEASTGDRVGAGVATAGAVIGGVMTAKDGIQKGGAKGYTQAASGVLMAAAPFDPTGITAAAAAITGIISSVLPDPRADRLKDIDADIEAARKKAEPYSDASQTVVMDSKGGDEVSYDKRGNLRVHEGSKARLEAFEQLVGFRDEDEHNGPGKKGDPMFRSTRRVTYSGQDERRVDTTISQAPESPGFGIPLWAKILAPVPTLLTEAVADMMRDDPPPSVYRHERRPALERAPELPTDPIGRAKLGLPPAVLARAVPDFSDGRAGSLDGPGALTMPGADLRLGPTPAEGLDAFNKLGFAPRERTSQAAETVRAMASNVTNHYSVNLPISAMDSTDVLRRSGAIADAVVQALQSTHRLREDIRQVVSPH